MTISEQGKDLAESFSFMDDWTEKYQYMIDLSKSLDEMNLNYKTDENLIKGCQSKVWLYSSYEKGKIHFQADSDAIISKGIVAILLSVLNNRSPLEILSADLSFIDEIGLKEHLSPNRANGLSSMLKQIKFYALAYSKLNQK
jgi:cysteine desulfuration protein SufE